MPPISSQRTGRNDSKSGEQKNSDRQLEGETECQHHAEGKTEILSRLDHWRQRRRLETVEESERERQHDEEAQSNAAQEKHYHPHQRRNYHAFLVRVQSRRKESPQLVPHHRSRE